MLKPRRRYRHLGSVLLLLSTTLASHTQALDVLGDEGLRTVNAQAGVEITFVDDNFQIGSIAYQDGDSSAPLLRLNDLNMQPLNTRFRFDVGSDASISALSIETLTQPFQLKTSAMQINDPSGNAVNTFGLFALETLSPTEITFRNLGGLFNNNGTGGQLIFNAQGANWYLAQPRLLTAGGGNGDPSQGYNVLVFKGFNIKGQANGKFGADPVKGLNFVGSLSLPRINATNGGFQLDLGFKNQVNFNNSSLFDFALINATPTTPYFRFGFSGDLPNSDYGITGGVDSGIGTGLGSTGIILRPQFQFARTGETNPFELELGEPQGTTVRFANWTALSDGAGATPSRALINMGALYINLLPPVSGNGLAHFTASANSSFGLSSPFGLVTTSTVALQNSAAIALRGFELQGGARSITFFDAQTGAALSTPQSWALMPTFYNVNANLLLYPSGHPNATVRHGSGLDLLVESTGKNTAAGTPSTRGTHLIVADTTANKYIGFRNIDGRYSFLDAQLYVADPSFDFAAGSGLDVSGLRLSSRNMSFDIRADLAIGDLPDGTAARQMRDDDAFAGMRWKFGGDFSLTLSAPPNGQSYIGLSASLNATDPAKNGVYIVEPVDGTRIEWIAITGRLNLLAQHILDSDFSDASRIDILREGSASFPGPQQRSMVSFATAYELAPGTGKNDVIRLGQLNLYRPPANNALFHGATSGGSCTPSAPCYREGVDWKPGFELSGTTAGSGSVFTLGEMVIPGGRFYGQIDLKVK